MLNLLSTNNVKENKVNIINIWIIKQTKTTYVIQSIKALFFII